jgi:LmbE family N-acetylglucosaminyl deacetylase
MKKALVILAHPDDEIFFSYHLYKKNETLEFVYLTNGVSDKFWDRISPQQRTKEAITALIKNGLISNSDQIHPVGQIENLRDGFLDVDFSSSSLEKLLVILKKGDFECIYTTEFEGAHQDHDTCNLISRRLGEQFKIPVEVFGTYPGRKRLLLKFDVMPIRNKVKTQHKDRLKVISLSLRMMSNYPSQWKTWSVLGPLMIAKLIFSMPKSPLRVNYSNVELIQKPLYQQMKRRVSKEVFENHLQIQLLFNEISN